MELLFARKGKWRLEVFVMRVDDVPRRGFVGVSDT